MGAYHPYLDRKISVGGGEETTQAGYGEDQKVGVNIFYGGGSAVGRSGKIQVSG